VIGVFMPNVPEYAIVIHGAASAGGMCMTVNPAYTANELTHQLEDSGARMLVTVPAGLEVAIEAAERAGVDDLFVVGEDSFTGLLGDPAEAPRVEIDPAEDVAVLPYSSGTTGLPKGVMLTHRNLVANLLQAEPIVGAGPDDVLIGCLPFFHIYGMQVIMNLGLHGGATIVSMPRFELGQYLDLIESHRATRLFVVPPIALALAKHPSAEGRDFSSVDFIVSGAAPLGSELSDRLKERTGAKVTQGYGLTETSPVTHNLHPDDDKPGSIGPPLIDTEVRVIDTETGEDLGDGERGELWIRGPQVMKGYLNNEEATAATIDSDGWLHTGDIGVRDADGHYEIVDRLKELIKYKGFQVPPAELEALIITHPGVADVAVIGVPDEEAGELPKAYVVAADDDLDPEELIGWIAERIAPQKRVRLIELTDEIPKSPSGKILRRVLKDREQAAQT
jgi:acyl-CoA synthetase (AMP-forming)/AMP-acid ligase II